MSEADRPTGSASVSKQQAPAEEQEQKPRPLMALGFVLMVISLIAYLLFGQPLL